MQATPKPSAEQQQKSAPRSAIWLGEDILDAEDKKYWRNIAHKSGWRLSFIDEPITNKPPVNGGLFIADLRHGSAAAIAWLDQHDRQFEQISRLLAIANPEQGADLAQIERFNPAQILLGPIGDEALRQQLRLAARSLQNEQVHHDQPGCDPLTGLADDNRIRKLVEQWRNEQQSERRVHGMIIRLRKLDAINSAYGEQVGDAIITTMARRIALKVEHENDCPVEYGRVNGSAFVVIAHQLEDRLSWMKLAEKLLDEIGCPVHVNGLQLRLTARIALACLREEEGVQSYFSRLDNALIEAMDADSMRVHWADRRSDKGLGSGYRLEQDVMRSIEREEIRIMFQPQFSIADQRLIGAEALVRWRHRDMGEIGAQTLFSLADRADYTRILSHYIRAKAMEIAAQWPKELSHLRLSLNMTAQDLDDSRFVEEEIGLIEQSGFRANRLTLEVTESALLPNIERAGELLQNIRSQGPAIAIDDFGTGYSNFLYLRHLPLDYLKLDYAMIRDIVTHKRDRVIVRSLIALASALGARVVAEGVENAKQLAVLKADGCDFYQGFFHGKVMRQNEFVDFAKNWLNQQSGIDQLRSAKTDR